MLDLRPGDDRVQGECLAGHGSGELLWTAWDSRSAPVMYWGRLPSMPPPLCPCSGQILLGSHLSQGKYAAFPPRASGREMRQGPSSLCWLQMSFQPIHQGSSWGSLQGLRLFWTILGVVSPLGFPCMAAVLSISSPHCTPLCTPSRRDVYHLLT